MTPGKWKVGAGRQTPSCVWMF